MAAKVMRKVVLTGLIAAIGVAILCGLGVWQVKRLAWKEGLIAMVNERTERPAEPLPSEADWPSINHDDDEYRKVELTGRFDNDHEIHVFTSLDDPRFPVSGPGYWVLTPLDLADGSTVIVNRGFVPGDKRGPATRPQGTVDGEVAVTGLIRMPEPGNLFMPDPDAARDQWYVRDPAAIAAAFGLTRVAPFFVDADASPNPGGLPLGGTTRITFHNDHLGYAVTWFGLALALVGVYVAWAYSQIRRGGTLADRAGGQ
jgi:surfeit locus 1 family protein